MNIPNLAMMDWAGDMDIWKKKDAPESRNPRIKFQGG